MKPEWVEVDRSRQVRDAVRGWRSAGLVDDRVVEAATALYPLRGPEVSWIWRLLTFVLVSFASGAMVVAAVMILDIPNNGVVGTTLVLYGVLMAWLTDALMNRFGYSDTGGEAATCAVAILSTVTGVLLLLSRLDIGEARLLALAASVLGAFLALASWRWGYWLCAAGSAAAFCYLVLTLRQPALLRMLIGVCGVILAAYYAFGPGSDRRPPARRRSLAAVLAVWLLALYSTVNLYALDYGILSELRFGGTRTVQTAGAGIRALAGAGTVLIPCALLAWGIITRRRLLLDIGILTVALSLATLRFYVHVAPLWVVAGSGGAALILISLALARYLKTGPSGERSGFTSHALYDERRRERLLPIAAAVALTPSARPVTQTDPEFKGGGGTFGGGGASGEF